MKNIALPILFIFLAISVSAQAPQAFKYQAVARDNSGNVLANKSVSFRISILNGGENGTLAYSEMHTGKTTNAFGLVDLEIGRGTPVTGTFYSVNWYSGIYYLKVELDPLGGIAYQVMGTSQLLSVPYALHAKNVELEADGDAANEIQILNLNGNQLSLSKGGGTVTLPSTGGGDGWGTQTVVTDATLAGNGTVTTPLKIAPQSAASGQVLKWNGTTWKPASDETGAGFTLPYAGSLLRNNLPVFSITNPGTGQAIWGESASGTAILGMTDGKNTSGVFGLGHALSGVNYAVRGENDSPDGFSGYFLGTKFYISGNAGLGIESPTARLDIDGQIKIRGGSPGEGKVLTSDASGLAIWKMPEPCLWNNVGSYYDGQQLRYNIAYTNGKVGVGTIAPSAMFELQGSFRYNYGSPGQGKVLTSDASGFVSWQTPEVFSLPYTKTFSSAFPLISITNSGTGNGLLAISQGVTGTTGGVIGEVYSTSGAGLVGTAWANAGTNFGVKGKTYSNDGFSGYFEGGKFYVSGNVGIGTTSPGYKLDVIGDRIRLTDATNDWIAMRTDGGTNEYLDLSWGGGSLVMQGATTNENIIMNPSMNKVGIRTWTPQYDLDVNGNIRAIGSVYYGGTTSTVGTAYTKPDYVFGEEYPVLKTEEVENFLQINNHLPWVTSVEQEKKENGGATDMTRMAFETLESVENLQLQLIGQIKLVKELKSEIERLTNENNHAAGEIFRIREENQLLMLRLEKIEAILSSKTGK